jgi:hypothetical protein
MNNNITQKLHAYVGYHWNGEVLSNMENKNGEWRFKCKNGHTFKRTLDSIGNGNFCTICNINSEISGITDVVNSASNLMYSIGSIVTPISNAIMYISDKYDL